jgi:hypothetical protein
MMTVLVLIALGWLGLRTLLLLAQVAHHRPEAQLARSFEQELAQRGLRPPSGPSSGDP